MEINDIKCHSKDAWWPHIKPLAESFAETFNKKGEKFSVNVKFSYDKLELALKSYKKKLAIFKIRTYGKDANNNRIDRHKIIALYIECFLKEQPFSVEGILNIEKNKDYLPFMLVNEFFSLAFMYAVINSWHGKSEPFKMEKTEKKWFIILLNHFRLNPDALDFLSLSQIIYYIEKPYAPKENNS